MNFSFKHTHFLFVGLTVLLCSLQSGCQKPSSDVIVEKKEQSNVTEKPVPDLNLICENLKKEMLQMTGQRTTFALEQVNQDIRMCLPLMASAEQKSMMKLADQMYQQFLHIQRTPEQQQAFNQYAFDQSQYPTIQQSHFEQLHPRDQYLLRHKGQAYIELSDETQSESNYRRSPQYLAKVFAPYFPEAEKVFMQELGSENQQPLISNQNITITPDEIVRRALFWENYINKYPDSEYHKDARYLSQVYSTILFIGLPRAPVSTNFEGSLDIQIIALNEIEKLATQKNSRLADQARQFLKFIELGEEQRSKLMKIQPSSSAMNKNELAKFQLMNYLNLKSFDPNRMPKRDCFSDAVCR